MPISLTARLESDEDFRKKITKVVKDYVSHARTTLDFYTPDFDAAHDILMCYATLSKKDYISLSKGHPKRFVLPITATHIHTMTTFIATALFSEQAHKVEPGGPDDDAPARMMNELLKWNAEQQQAGMFQLGFMWVENALTYNRGIFYDCYSSIQKSRWQTVETPVLDDEGNPTLDPLTNLPATTTEIKKVKEKVGGFCQVEIVSPYDFYMDPLLPIYRLQEGRFAGHRMNKPWSSLQGRTKLEEDDPMYLSGPAVLRLKKKGEKGLEFPGPSGAGNTAEGDMSSRTSYERGKVSAPVSEKADTKDPGVTVFDELWVKLVPADYDIDERTDPEVFQITLGDEKEVCSLNESTYEHDQYPYAVGEPRPSPFYQYSPSWVMVLKNIQDYVDYLKNRHQEAVSKTVGNVFIAKSNLIDIKDFEDPDKEGKFISILPEASSQPINDIIRQVPIVDMTANFLTEMKGFISFAESTSGANQNLQGQTIGGQTATEFAGTQQMAAGRLTAIARLLSVQGVVPQTKRMVSNFQQFFDSELVRRVVGEDDDVLAAFAGGPATITGDTIQGGFTFRAHDGTLPAADTKRVAALTRSIEAMQLFPQIFQPGEGNLDPRRIFLDLFRVSGMQPERYRYRKEDLAKIQQQQAEAQLQQALMANVMQGPQVPVGGPTAAPPGGGAPPDGNVGAGTGPSVSNDLTMPPEGLPGIEPPQVRPSNV